MGGVGAPADVADFTLPAAGAGVTTPAVATAPLETTVPTTTRAVATTRVVTTAAVAETFTPGGAALGGGGGAAATQGTLQVISGYNPPASSVPRVPSQSTGTILNASDIPGYTDEQVGNQNSGSASGALGQFSVLPMTFAAGLVGVLAAIVMV